MGVRVRMTPATPRALATAIRCRQLMRIACFLPFGTAGTAYRGLKKDEGRWVQRATVLLCDRYEGVILGLDEV